MTTRDRCLGLVVVLLWGVNFIAIHLGLDHFPPFFFAALRFAVMALPVMLFVGFPRVRIGWFLLYGAGFGTLQFAFLFLAMHVGMPTGLASLVLQTSAPFTVILGVLFLRERMNPLQTLGIVAAVGGMALIAVDQATGTSAGVGALIPIGLTVLAGLSWAVGNIAGRMARPDDALRMTLWMSVIPPIPLYLLSLIVEGPGAGFHAMATLGSHSGLAALGGLTYLVVLGTIAGAGIWMSLIAHYEASRVAPLSLLVPVVGISASWALLGEAPTVIALIGAAIVIVGCATGVLAAPVSRPRAPSAQASRDPIASTMRSTPARAPALSSVMLTKP
ncbi:EamA family transporter [Gordonia sp. ABSL1-1]|uniref:EamA family transporter n=1 Tax=Gordonia sp. ABSL1-1 TaxID=3053923 RepID=UPI00257272B2|nr:EamA family transporter [Gordonia sp. ABSL1-1]MDL9937590.1 EamA family transporter [Gordonia sp. ABSL1-1]